MRATRDLEFRKLTGLAPPSAHVQLEHDRDELTGPDHEPALLALVVALESHHERDGIRPSVAGLGREIHAHAVAPGLRSRKLDRFDARRRIATAHVAVESPPTARGRVREVDRLLPRVGDVEIEVRSLSEDEPHAELALTRRIERALAQKRGERIRLVSAKCALGLRRSCAARARGDEQSD